MLTFKDNDFDSVKYEAQEVLNFKLDEAIQATTVQFVREPNNAYAVHAVLNKSIITCILETNENPLSVLKGLRAHWYPIDASSKPTIENVMVSTDGMRFSTTVSNVTNKVHPMLLCLVKDDCLIAAPMRFKMTESDFEKNCCMVPDVLALNQSLLEQLKLRKYCAGMNVVKSNLAAREEPSMARLQSISNVFNMNALHIAAALNKPALCLHLLKNGYELKSKDILQRNAASIAKLMGNSQLCKYLESLSIEENMSDSYLWNQHQETCNCMCLYNLLTLG